MSPPVPILMVEDDPDDADVAIRALRRASLDASLEIARDGQEALEMLGLEPEEGGSPRIRPRVIFLDLKLPRVDGFEVLRRLRARSETASLPVIVVSSSDDEEDVRRSYAMGANSFLVKRFDPRGAGLWFAEAVRYWTQLNQPPPAGGATR